MLLANFSRSVKVPSENEKLISLTIGFDRTEHESLSILVGILYGSTDFEVSISFISDSTSSLFIGVRKMNLPLRLQIVFMSFVSWNNFVINIFSNCGGKTF